MILSMELGSSHVKVYSEERGLILYEPSILVAKNKSNKSVLKEFGKSAYELSLKLGNDEKLVKPIKNGVISDFHCAKLLLDKVLDIVVGNRTMRKQLELVLCVPTCATTAQVNEFVKLLNSCGVTAITLRPQLCCICSLLDNDITNPYFIVDIGAGKTEIGITTPKTVIDAISLSLAGDMIDMSIHETLKHTHNISISKAGIEQLKENVASLYATDATTAKVRALNLANSTWQDYIVSSQDIYDSLIICYDKILEGVIAFYNSLDERYQAIVKKTGIFFSGLGCKISGFEKYAQSKLNLDVYILDVPVIATVEGALN